MKNILSLALSGKRGHHAALFAVLTLFAVGPLRAADLSALWKERVKSVVSVEFFTETEDARRATIVAGLVADANGTIALPPGVVSPRVTPAQLKDFRVHLPSEPAGLYAHAEYLGQDNLSGWNFVRVEEKVRAKLTPITVFAGPPGTGEPAMAEEVWGIGLRGKDEDFLPYLMVALVSLVQSLPERTAYTLSEVAAPGLPVFNRAGEFIGVGVGGFYSTYLQLGGGGRSSTVALMNVEESRVFVLASEAMPWLARVPTSVSGRPIPWFGASVGPMDPELEVFLKLETQSACNVSEVYEGSPAEKAGIKAGDIIVAVSGRPLPRLTPDRVAVQYFEREVDRHAPGDKLTLTVLRGSERIELMATLGDEPKLAREAERKYSEKLGLTVREFVFGDGVVRRVKLAEQRGVIAHFVKSNTPVSAAGLRPEDWIQEIDGTEVKTYTDALAKLAAIEADTTRAEFVLLVSRGGETQVLRVKLK
jgi:serine protease Do